MLAAYVPGWVQALVLLPVVAGGIIVAILVRTAWSRYSAKGEELVSETTAPNDAEDREAA